MEACDGAIVLTVSVPVTCTASRLLACCGVALVSAVPLSPAHAGDAIAAARQRASVVRERPNSAEICRVMVCPLLILGSGDVGRHRNDGK